ncbi:MAG: ribonuclease [Lysobacteraceae bacterium]|nr:MAG: ribonuclease [Xanthomonadaceae bacterium]
MRKLPPLLLLLLLLAGWWWLQKPAAKDWPTDAIPPATTATLPVTGASSSPSDLAFLPSEAHRTLALIRSGGPYPYPQDDGVFGNREGHLPKQPRGYYREYTVDTPGLSHRGARRIITGGKPPSEYYYTNDHYDSFRSFTVTP